MSARPLMSCESCRDLLMELVCDELPADKAADVRAHAASCERCGRELAKLERTLRAAEELPLLTPSPEVERRIMQAARAAMAGRAKGPAREQQLPESGVAGWFARVSAWAMSPQVAMASVLILVVGIGLYALPIGQAPDSTALRATEDESESAPVEAPAPSASATAAPTPEPEAQAEERRNDAREAAGGAARDGKQSDPYADKLAAKAPVARPGKARSVGKGGVYKDENALREAWPQAEAASSDERIAREAKRSDTAARKAEPERESSQGGSFAPAPPAAAAPLPVDAQKKQAPATMPKPSASGAAKPSSTADLGSITSKEKESTDSLARGITASQRGDHAQARALLEPITRSGTAAERAQANLWLARSLRAQGDCGRALVYYRPLTQPLTASRDVLLEAADCYARTGNEASATRLRGRAQVPGEKTRD